MDGKPAWLADARAPTCEATDESLTHRLLTEKAARLELLEQCHYRNLHQILVSKARRQSARLCLSIVTTKSLTRLRKGQRSQCGAQSRGSPGGAAPCHAPRCRAPGGPGAACWSPGSPETQGCRGFPLHGVGDVTRRGAASAPEQHTRVRPSGVIKAALHERDPAAQASASASFQDACLVMIQGGQVQGTPG